MAIEFRCGTCQSLLRVADDNAGKEARCPQCKGISPVPAPPIATDLAFAADTSEDSHASAYDAPSQTEPPSANPYAAPRADIVTGRISSQFPLASLWKRLGGSILDTFVYGLAMVPGMASIILLDGVSDEAQGIALLIFFGGIALVAVYNWILITRTGQSIAKRMLGMRIVTTDGELPGFLRGVLLRLWIPLIIHQFCGLFSFVDALVIFIGEQRRCIHDYLAGTIVVDTEIEAQQRAANTHDHPFANG